MTRITKEKARQLIPFVKSLYVKYDTNEKASKSAFEFAKQTFTSKMRKINPTFQLVTEPCRGCIPELKADFLDGSQWAIDTSHYHLSDIRSEFYTRLQDVEDAMDADDGAKGKDAGKGKGGKK